VGGCQGVSSVCVCDIDWLLSVQVLQMIKTTVVEGYSINNTENTKTCKCFTSGQMSDYMQTFTVYSKVHFRLSGLTPFFLIDIYL